MKHSPLQSERGMASVEFAGIAMVIMALAFGIVEFGSLLRAQSVVTNVTREGGSLASRDLKNGSDLLTLLEASTWPLNFSCPADDATCVPSEQEAKFKIYITKVNAGSSQAVDPTCASALQSGLLAGTGITSPNQDPLCGLTQELWDMLSYDTDYGTSLLSQLTVVKVYYRHDPLTPLATLLKTAPFFGNQNVEVLNFNSGGGGASNGGPQVGSQYDSFLLGSKAVF